MRTDLEDLGVIVSCVCVCISLNSHVLAEAHICPAGLGSSKKESVGNPTFPGILKVELIRHILQSLRCWPEVFAGAENT